MNDARFADIKRCAKYLALAMIEHNHLVRGDYEVLEWLAKVMEGYDEDGVKVYTRLYKRYSTYVIPSCLHYYVEVVLNMPNKDLLQINGVSVKPVQYTYFLVRILLIVNFMHISATLISLPMVLICSYR